MTTTDLSWIPDYCTFCGTLDSLTDGLCTKCAIDHECECGRPLNQDDDGNWFCDCGATD